MTGSVIVLADYQRSARQTRFAPPEDMIQGSPETYRQPNTPLSEFTLPLGDIQKALPWMTQG